MEKSTAQSMLDQAVQETAENRELKRKVIQSQIDLCDAELTSVSIQVSELTAEQSKLNTYLSDWEAQKLIYNGNAILSEVVIPNVFEGVCADRIREEFSAGIAEMDQTCGRVGRLNENLSAQIARLNQYISDINAQLASLRNQLGSI